MSDHASKRDPGTLDAWAMFRRACEAAEVTSGQLDLMTQMRDSERDRAEQAEATLARLLVLHAKSARKVRSWDNPCERHAYVPGSGAVPRIEAMEACPDCRYTEYETCSHCACPNDRWPCPTIQALDGLAELADAGLVVVRRSDVLIAWGWAVEALAELPEGQLPAADVRPDVDAALERLYALLETPQPANAVDRERSEQTGGGDV